MNGPVTAAALYIAGRHEADLDHPDRPLRMAAWEAFTADLHAFLTDVRLCAAYDLDVLVRYAFHRANGSLLAGGDGGPWWAFLVAFGDGDGLVS